VDERASEDALDYTVRATARVGAAGRLVVESDDEALAERIAQEYARIVLSVLSPGDVGSWLVDVVRALDGVALRPTGGFYFIPRTAVSLWNVVVQAVKRCSNHGFYAVPALHADEAVEAVLAAVTAEGKSLAEETWAMLQDEKLGARALTSRAGALEAARSKVERYETLLGVAVPELCAALEGLRANCAAAALLAEEEKSYAGTLDGSALDALAAL
jgi:hypothetical protein